MRTVMLRNSMVIGLFLLLMACTTDAQQINSISPKELVEMMKEPGVQLVDVRTTEEINRGMIAKATNIDYMSEGFAEKVAKLDKQKPIVVYCAVGGRSARAASKLSELGFTEVYDLDGGIRSWEQAGLAITKPKN